MSLTPAAPVAGRAITVAGSVRPLVGVPVANAGPAETVQVRNPRSRIGLAVLTTVQYTVDPPVGSEGTALP